MRWQVSMLGLLAITSAVALYLMFANYFPRLSIAIFIGGAVWAALLLFVDGLMTRARPRSWALLTVAAWAAVGTLFLLISVLILSLDKGLSAIIGDASWVLGASLAGGALMCYLGALGSFLRSRDAEAKERAKSNSQTGSKPPS